MAFSAIWSGGIFTVCALGHANEEITAALVDQSKQLVHVSNLYYTEPQGRLAEQLSRLIGPGRCFFCNSGAEANEGLYKLARKFGHDEGRFEILTAQNSFHGRTRSVWHPQSATGPDKVKKGFEPSVTGFRHVPFNDLQAMRAALSPATAAVLIEAIQGERGVNPATPEYLLGLRKLCDEKKLLLLIDEVQAGHFRTGRFQSYGNGFLKMFLVRRIFLRMAFRWQSRSAVDFPSGRFGRGNPTVISYRPERMLRPLEAHQWVAR